MNILDVIGGTLVTLILLPVLISLWVFGSNEVEKRQAANQLAAVNQATASYVRTNYSTLLTQTTASTGPAIDIGPLVAGNFLQAGFQGKNVWGQTYQIYFRQPAATTIQAIVLTTGGRGSAATDTKFNNSLVPSASAMVGGQGGFIPTGTISGQAAGTLRGAFGGWTTDLASVGIPSPGVGHLGALSNFDSSSLGQDFLYRVAVPGHPEVNAMQTSLDMTNNNVLDLHDLQFTPRTMTTEDCADPAMNGHVFLDPNFGLYICRNGSKEVVSDTGNSTPLSAMTLAKDGDVITKPICPPGTNTTAQIFVTPAIASAGANAPPINAFQAYATNTDSTTWTVHLRLLTTYDNLGWVNPGANYGKIIVCTTCAKGS
ncbi:MAG: shufflon system plasmid conjugative transfer pilus tip adhesin PilV [Desulfovibrionaceae bacterium]|nr:shufflon system plasmid conjugative transfer pilus tip adhesin PilV [Desulfovibrionaceae bacterium]MBF0515098.1 shufflon system plasmid conjugative transfer pilus tip adhesin PilV [Desulfovibrionaceae bacterium]